MKRYTHLSEHNSIEELWEVQMELALKFKKVCEENNLKYFLSGGSLLGAIRQEGFIPWNDDIDFSMPREDYEKLIEISSDVFQSPYTFQTPMTTKDIYYGGSSRLRHDKTTCINPNDILSKSNQGIWIDIIPLDYYECDIKKRNKQINKIKMYQRLSYAKVYHMYGNIIDLYDLKWKIYTTIAPYINKDFLVKQEYKWRTKCKKANELVNYNYSINNNNPKSYNIKIFEETTEVNFNGEKFKAPRNYTSYLKNTYGANFLTPPPVTERIPSCINYFIDSKLSYDKYLNKVLRDKKYIEKDMLTYKKAKEKTIILYGSNIMIENYLKNTSSQYIPEFIVVDKNNDLLVKLDSYYLKKGTLEDMMNVPSDERIIIVCSINYKDYLEKLLNLGIKEAYVFCGSRINLVNQFKKNNILLCLDGFPVVYDM